MFRQEGSTACLPQPPCDRDLPGSAARSVFISWFFLKKVFPYIATKSFFIGAFTLGVQLLFFSNKKGKEDNIPGSILQHRWWLREATKTVVTALELIQACLTPKALQMSPHSGSALWVSARSEGIWPKAVSGSWGPASARMEDCLGQKEGEYFSNSHCPHRVWASGMV